MNPTVLVTRPYAQGLEFVDLLKSKSIEGLLFPCIEIQAIELTQALRETFKALNNYNVIIFISVNAVKQASYILKSLGIEPSHICVKIAAIGKATLKAAIKCGFKVDLSADKGFNSEALLALQALQAQSVKGQTCLIVRGVGGLNTLADELSLRGANVSYAEIYRRKIPCLDKGLSRQLLSKNWADFKIKLITATSNECIQNLYDMVQLSGKTALLKTPLIVASERGIKLAEALGFKIIKLAPSAMNQHILEIVETEFKVIQ